MRLDIPTAILAMIVTAVLFTAAAITVWPEPMTATQETKVACYDQMQAMWDTSPGPGREQAQDALIASTICWP